MAYQVLTWLRRPVLCQLSYLRMCPSFRAVDGGKGRSRTYNDGACVVLEGGSPEGDRDQYHEEVSTSRLWIWCSPQSFFAMRCW